MSRVRIPSPAPFPSPGSWWLCDGSVLGSEYTGTWNLTTSATYDSHGNRLTETAPNGRITTYLYDGADRQVQRIDNDVATPTQADQDLSTYLFYDDAGRQVAVQAPTLDRTTFSVTRFVYDPSTGRLTSEIRNCTNTGTTPPENPATCAGSGTVDADTNVVTSYAYDTRGNRVRVTAPDPSAAPTGAATVTHQYAFDADGRLCRVVENATGSTDLQALSNPCSDATQTTGTTTTNVSTRYVYDGAGNLTSMIDGRGKTTSYAYDASARMTSLTDALGEVLAYEYDNLGRRTKQTLRTFPGPFITWTYDGAGRQLTRTADGVTTSSTFDANGNRLAVSDGTRTITTTYDRLNRPLIVSISGDSAATTTYSYSLASPSWTDPTGTYLVSLDKFDRQVSLDDPVQAAQTTTYRADGQPAGVAAPNGNTTAFAYDDLGRPTSKTTSGTGGVSRAAYAWTPNRASQITAETSTITGDPTNGTTTYTYDPLARLTSFARSGSTTSYGWQEVPNRSSVQVGINPATTYGFDNANRPTSDSAGGTYTSDDDGRLTVRPGQRLEWDTLGRLTKVKPPTGNNAISEYTYDPLDRLVIVDHGGSNRIRFRYVGLTTSIAQFVDDGTGTVIRSIGTSWTGDPVADWTGTGQNLRVFGQNGHHDLTWTADSTGAVTATLRYDPWGTLTSSTGSSLPDLRFQSQYRDPDTDLSWFVARWYAPALSRFVSEDTLLGEPASPPSRHLYAYAEGEPVARWDPSGLAPSNSAPAYCGTWDTCAAPTWVGNANPRSYMKVFPNKLRKRGRIELAMFIPEPKNELPLLGYTYGDNRNFSSIQYAKCVRSRACLKIDFDKRAAWLTVNPTCGDYFLDLRAYRCHDAFSVCGSVICYNLLHVQETSASLKVYVSVSQSMYPVIPGVNTVEAEVEVSTSTWEHNGYISYRGEGFPSEEMFLHGPDGRRLTVFKKASTRNPLDMAPGFGDWSAKPYPYPRW